MSNPGHTSSTIICHLPEDVTKRLHDFRFRKSHATAALILAINKETLAVTIEESLEGPTMLDLQDALPDNLPRYVVLSYEYKHKDGRVSYPLIFIYWSPTTVKPEMHMLYAGSKVHIVQQCDCGKVFDIRDLDELTDEWLRDKLAFFN